MESITTVGEGYYNYYHIKGRYETTDGKARTAWYDRDLSTEEVQSNNLALNREYEGADVCRRVAASLQSVAASNRSRYADPDEMKNAVYAKYDADPKYRGYSSSERAALARAEINMTLFGTVDFYDARIISEMTGETTKNTVGSTEEGNRSFNLGVLGLQLQNVWRNNGLDIGALGGSAFQIRINGFSQNAEISLVDANGNMNLNDSLLKRMTDALNSGKNARNLFHNMLYDANKQGLLPTDELAKWRLYARFKDITGLDIRDFTQTDDGFVNSDGETADEIYRRALETSDNIPVGFKGADYGYFLRIEQDALQYKLDEVPELTLSAEYQGGSVRFYGETSSFAAAA